MDRMREARGEDPSVEQLFHDLQVYHEELAVQNQQLLDTQHQLEESRDKFADLYHFAPVAFLTFDQNGVIHDLNLTAANLLGRPRARIEGMPFAQFTSKEHRREFVDFMRRCRGNSSGDRPVVALALTTPDGERSVEIVCSPRPGETPERFFLAVIIDHTDRLRLERERRLVEEERERFVRNEAVAAASAAAKDEFLARLSHELRTPLTPVLAALTDSELTQRAPPELRDPLALMRRNIELEVRLIDDLLDLTRITRGRLTIARELVDVHVAIRDVVGMLSQTARARQVELVHRLDAAARLVIGDGTRLRQVLWNLVNNALKFTPHGGRVTITSFEVEGGELRVSVSDTGRGMNEEMLNRLFDASAKAHEGGLPPEAGLGLGLAICQGIVEAHGGTIHGASAGLGVGSTFTLTLPGAFAPEASVSLPPAAPASAAAPASPLQILLVEDDDDTALMMSTLLGLHAHRVTVARSVADAVRLAKTQQWDLLISDIRLPDGSGLDLLRRLGDRRARHAIAVSGFGSREDILRSLDAGFDEHLVKPLDMGTLLETIARLQRPGGHLSA
jgi:PAS domain S-box-containing protein